MLHIIRIRSRELGEKVSMYFVTSSVRLVVLLEISVGVACMVSLPCLLLHNQRLSPP